MASIFDGVDISDPCAVWPVLDRALIQLLAGERVASARFESDDVRFSRADVPELRRKIAELKDECAAEKSGRRKRRAFRAAHRC